MRKSYKKATKQGTRKRKGGTRSLVTHSDYFDRNSIDLSKLDVLKSTPDGEKTVFASYDIDPTRNEIMKDMSKYVILKKFQHFNKNGDRYGIATVKNGFVYEDGEMIKVENYIDRIIGDPKNNHIFDTLDDKQIEILKEVIVSRLNNGEFETPTDIRAFQAIILLFLCHLAWIYITNYEGFRQIVNNDIREATAHVIDGSRRIIRNIKTRNRQIYNDRKRTFEELPSKIAFLEIVNDPKSEHPQGHYLVDMAGNRFGFFKTKKRSFDWNKIIGFIRKEDACICDRNLNKNLISMMNLSGYQRFKIIDNNGKIILDYSSFDDIVSKDERFAIFAQAISNLAPELEEVEQNQE